MGGSAVNTSSGFVAILTLPGGMEEEQWLFLQYSHRDCHDVSGTYEPCMGMSHLAFRLQASFPQPVVDQGKPRAAVVVFAVTQTLQKFGLNGYARSQAAF